VSSPVQYHHVDVFAQRPYRGNSLVVFPDSRGLTGAQMDQITKELRHFESIFLETGPGDRTYRARVFDLIEELDFAGHPVIGAAAVVHALAGTGGTERWTIQLKARTVTIETEQRGASLYAAALDQGPAQFLGGPGAAMRDEIAAWFSLTADDLDPLLAPEVVSTGLRYLVVPVRGRGLPAARIACADLEIRLANLGAQYAYLVDAESFEGRHWTNDGLVEDVATGSGAGCVAAYLRRHERIPDGDSAILRQGRFVGRPSEITLRARGRDTDVRVVVGGTVVLVGEGQLNALPE
jgi:trans-2,3-dihydro-3-hydroxyanthranilate isomerase